MYLLSDERAIRGLGFDWSVLVRCMARGVTSQSSSAFGLRQQQGGIQAGCITESLGVYLRLAAGIRPRVGVHVTPLCRQAS